MLKTNFKTRRRAGAVLRTALTLFLVLSLLTLPLLTGCAKGPKTGDTTVPSTPAPTEGSTEAPVTTPPAETAAPAPVSTEPAETEPAVTLPPDWTPTLNKTDISFFGPGETFILTVPGAPGGLEILWTAENEEIASVDQSGRVTAVGPGTARIYAEVAGTKLSCWIRCPFDAPPAEDAPALNKTDISFFGAGESFRLTVSNAPEDAEILWSSEDYGVASVDQNGRVRAVGPGTIRVRAQVNGDAVLSCWVRCHFAAPELPRSSVADGSWRVTLHKSSITAQNEEAGIYVAQAEILSRIQVTKDELDELESYDKLDLTRFGLGTWRVSSVAFSADGKTCTVTAGDAVLLFSRDGDLWTLVDADGETRYYTSGTGRFVFTDSSKVYEQTGGASGPMNRCADVEALFDLRPGFEETVTPVILTVSDGLVTNAVWQYD